MKRADHHLVQQVLDGNISKDAFAAFQQRLRDEPEFSRLYDNYALLNHTLCEEFEGRHAAGEHDLVPARSDSRSRLLLVIATVLALMTAVLWVAYCYNPNDEVADVAALSFSVDAVWRIDGASHHLGAATGVTRGATLHLSAGRAAITLEPSVSALIEGPAEVVFLTRNALQLDRGRGWFHRSATAGRLTVVTPDFTTLDSGIGFGIEVSPDNPDELHAVEGDVSLVAKIGNDHLTINEGTAARILGTRPPGRIPLDGPRFATGLDRFHPLVAGAFDKAQWRVEYGNPSFSAHRIEGVNYSAYLGLPGPQPVSDRGVLLATLDVGKPAEGEFHTDGWAGMSFFSRGVELLFFGDSYGAKPTWSLDVKQHIPVILPEHPVADLRKVTLRYDLRSGAVSLHEGGVPLKSAFCAGKLPPGTRFDEIRLGASAGAALTVNALEIRVGGN